VHGLTRVLRERSGRFEDAVSALSGLRSPVVAWGLDRAELREKRHIGQGSSSTCGIVGTIGIVYSEACRRPRGFETIDLYESPQVFTDGDPFPGPQEHKFSGRELSVIPAPQEISLQKQIARATPAWHVPFVPRRGLLNGHLQTIVGNYLPRPAFRVVSTPETVEVDPIDGSRVLCQCSWQPDDVRAARLTVILVHGLEGSSDSQYIQGLAARAWLAGFNVIRMNMRNCGDTDSLSPTLYHSGLSGDVGRVIDHFTGLHGLRRVALVGYSMGGNLVLKLAGEWGMRSPLFAVAAVCPAVDLAAGSDALHEPVNRGYEWHFLRRLMRRFRRKAALYPAIYDVRGAGTIRSLRDFDDKIVARYCGFRDADDYYYRAAGARVVDRIAVPTLILRALDDPFIRIVPDTRAAILANSNISFVETPHGGHCAYLSSDPGNEIHWAEATVMRYLMNLDSENHGS
jgi:predicted alpha/beta-fold hydrolase